MKPWGHVDWVLRWYPNRRWKIISSVGFEPRCTALFSHFVNLGISPEQAIALRLDDPDSDYTEEIDIRTDNNQNTITACFPEVEYCRAPLMERGQRWRSLLSTVCDKPNASIILDLTSLPKRVGLFILRELLRDKLVKDIVVCYTRAESYKEGHFVLDEQHPAALPGFGSLSPDEDRESELIVGVGYSRFDIRQVLQQTSPNIHFLLPFPPASPSSRRTWRYLKELNENLEPIKPSIIRFNAIDMFSVHDWLVGHIDKSKHTIMLPLGPKPHSIAMALAQINRPTCSQLMYPQPSRYHPDYSSGVHVELDGKASIIAYALRRDRENVIQG